MTIRGMAKADNKEKHHFQGFEASSDSFVQVSCKIDSYTALCTACFNCKKYYNYLLDKNIDPRMGQV